MAALEFVCMIMCSSLRDVWARAPWITSLYLERGEREREIHGCMYLRMYSDAGYSQNSPNVIEIATFKTCVGSCPYIDIYSEIL